MLSINFVNISLNFQEKFRTNCFNTRPKIEEHIFIVIDESSYEERFSQALQSDIRHFKIGVTFLTG